MYFFFTSLKARRSKRRRNRSLFPPPLWKYCHTGLRYLTAESPERFGYKKDLLVFFTIISKDVGHTYRGVYFLWGCNILVKLSVFSRISIQRSISDSYKKMSVHHYIACTSNMNLPMPWIARSYRTRPRIKKKNVKFGEFFLSTVSVVTLRDTMSSFFSLR